MGDQVLLPRLDGSCKNAGWPRRGFNVQRVWLSRGSTEMLSAGRNEGV
jgi:hypothetical protein